MNDKFNWIPFYRELASSLWNFRSRQEELIRLIDRMFQITEIHKPVMDYDSSEPYKVLDPFTVFALFNKTMQSDSTRIRLAEFLKQELKIQAPVPTSFAGIPVVQSTSASFYLFDEQKPAIIAALWDLYGAALEYADTPDGRTKEKFIASFTTAVQTKNNGAAKISIGLYWLRPDSYLSLDKYNKEFLYSEPGLPEEMKKQLPAYNIKMGGNEYLKIVDLVREYMDRADARFHSFPELSYQSYSLNQKEKKVKKDSDGPNYYLYAAGPDAQYWEKYWKEGIIAIGWNELGDLLQYQDKSEILKVLREDNLGDIQAASMCWTFCRVLKPGDLIYVKSGKNTILGAGEVTSGYEYLQSEEPYRNIRRVHWYRKGNWHIQNGLSIKTLTQIPVHSALWNDLQNNVWPGKKEEMHLDVSLNPTNLNRKVDFVPYTEADFLEDVYVSSAAYRTMKRILERKKNLLLQGPPGTGKTFTAERLAWSMMGMKDPERIETVQFHPSYTYEDFLLGFRPDQEGFSLQEGTFYRFCEKARSDPEHGYFFIIDEINRGDTNRILGESLQLIESSRRGIPALLSYSGKPFAVPVNLYLIATMNTADRSAGMIDYALRRRFGIYTMKPAFDSEGFERYERSLKSTEFEKLVRVLKELNRSIQDDPNLGDACCIGQSELCGLIHPDSSVLKDIVEQELIPLISEYWYDAPSKVNEWTQKLERAVE